MKMRRFIFALLVCLITSTIIWGCNKDNGGETSDEDLKAQITFEEMKDKMVETQEMPMMFETESDLYETVYEKSVDKLIDSKFYEAFSVSSAKIFLAEVTDLADVEAIKADFEDCAIRVQNTFKEYLVDAYEMSKGAKVVSKGRYVLLVIAPDVDACIKVFEENIK